MQKTPILERDKTADFEKGTKSPILKMRQNRRFLRLHVISSYAISSAATSAVHTFNRLPFRPLANSTAANSTFLFKFKVIQFLQDVRKQVIIESIKRHQWYSLT